MLNKLIDAIKEAELRGRVAEVAGLEGLSGDKLVGSLQRFAMAAADTAYVEIGVYRGLTLVSVGVAAPGTAVFGIDNFSQFDLDGKNRSVVEKMIAANGLRNVNLINADYEQAFAEIDRHTQGRRIGTYFVDGPHDYRSQLMCLELARPHLADFAVIVIDDSNYQHVRQANRDFLVLHPQFKLLYEAYTRCHPNNMSAEEVAAARRGWWNGVNILVHDPMNVLDSSLPPVDPSRALFLNDHIVHASRMARCSDVAMETVSQLYEFHPLRTLRGVLQMFRWRKQRLKTDLPAYASANTLSEGLTSGRLNSKAL
ncbi:MAG: class I SAM-dependent methyltransferase [Steroidobacteraceae bacterium]